MLPESQHHPTGVIQSRSRLSVTALVALQLRQPIVRIRLRHHEVFRASVPEAPIDEHRDPATREHNVCRSSKCRFGTEVCSVPQSARVQERPHGPLRDRILRAVRDHGGSSVSVRGPGIRHASRVRPTLHGFPAVRIRHVSQDVSGGEPCASSSNPLEPLPDIITIIGETSARELRTY